MVELNFTLRCEHHHHRVRIDACFLPLFLLSLKTNINLGWWQVLRLAVDTLTWNAGFSSWVGSSIGRSVLVSWLALPPVQCFTHPNVLVSQLASSCVLDQARGCFKIKISEQWLIGYAHIEIVGIWVRLQPMHCCVLPFMTKCVQSSLPLHLFPWPRLMHVCITCTQQLGKVFLVQSCLANSQTFAKRRIQFTQNYKLKQQVIWKLWNRCKEAQLCKFLKLDTLTLHLGQAQCTHILPRQKI